MHLTAPSHGEHGYLVPRPQAWFAFALSFLLMTFDFIDRQIVVSMFPYLKVEWALSDRELGALISIVSVTIAIGTLPLSLLVDKWGRVKGVVVMATVWSLATIACAFAGSYQRLLTARADPRARPARFPGAGDSPPEATTSTSAASTGGASADNPQNERKRKGNIMAYETIEVRKTTPTIGAEIFGVDLSGQLSNHQFDEIHQALMDNLVIFFRDQKLSVEQHKAFGARFGKLHIHPNAPKSLPDHPEILVIKADENSKRVAGEGWHSDVSCDEEPPMGSILYLHDVPPDGGGDTLFANMYEAYETLSKPLRTMLDGMTAIHDSWKAHSDRKPGRGSDMQFPRFEHPVVRVHPVTGRKLLFVDRGFTTRIVQLSQAESDALLAFLFQHIETPKLSCRFRWEKNSIAFWDNRCAQHQAIFDYWPHRRYGHRVTIRGDRPYGATEAAAPRAAAQ